KQNSELRKALFFPVILILISFFFSGACDKKAPSPKAAPAKAAQEAATQSPEVKGAKVEEETYTYEKKGKRDPFVSLVVTATEKPKKGHAPLENYDVSVIKILGIVWTDKGNFATAVLPDGKAYTLRESMTIGIHEGKIQKINKDHIVIIERIKDYKGQLKSKETILKLREGEEE
ncbi:MAG: pilus assembly protein PilP, partial [Thermodesulfovibrionales bacterium]|nr:pilus assembly protein PilP [Thermodesulfovibrionales bacterium]